MRTKTADIADLADQILADIDRANLDEHQSPAYTKKASISTNTGRQMVKLAEELRTTTREITYDDLAEFRRRHGG